MTLANFSRVSGPISKPSHPSGMSIGLASFVLASLLKLSAITAWSESTKFTPASLAFCIISRAKSNLSSSQIEAPICPPKAFLKVKVIPPPKIRLSTLPNRFIMISILEETLDPPIIAVKGRSGFFITLSTLSNSPFITYPNNLSLGKNLAITAVEAWARCAVPKASLIQTSPNFDS